MRLPEREANQSGCSSQGETRQLTNGSGNVADTYFYSAYGTPLASTGTDTNPFKYGGEYGYYTDSAPEGLILCGARWYDPQIERWLSRDPIGYDGGDNLFAYCQDNPIIFCDPFGLDTYGFYVNSGKDGSTFMRHAMKANHTKGFITGADLIQLMQERGRTVELSAMQAYRERYGV